MKLFAFVMLAIFLLLYGLMAVTNFRIEFMAVIVGIAAIIAGVCFFLCIGRKEL